MKRAGAAALLHGGVPGWVRPVIATLLLCVAACDRSSSAPALAAPAAASARVTDGGSSAGMARSYPKPSDDELRRRLTPLEYEVTQNAATEPAFANAYWDNHAQGLYVDAATGEPLFSSRDKFDSGTGWPSFTRPIEPGRVVARPDTTLGMVRTEVRSREGSSHLGHVFEDGPPPTGLRYCINSAALHFIAVDRLVAEGYGEYASLFASAAVSSPTAAPGTPADGLQPNACTAPGKKPGCVPTLETAILAGGCFWGMEEILRKIPGVVSTEAGYAGGTAGVTYEDVHRGTTGNAESVRIVFDPSKLAYEDLLENWFFRMHDPTTRNRQGNDVGSQYRSAIFVTSQAQREVAERVKRRVDASGHWPAPVVTEIVDATTFTRAEEYHQRYLEKNPGGYTCHYLRDFSRTSL